MERLLSTSQPEKVSTTLMSFGRFVGHLSRGYIVQDPRHPPSSSHILPHPAHAPSFSQTNQSTLFPSLNNNVTPWTIYPREEELQIPQHFPATRTLSFPINLNGTPSQFQTLPPPLHSNITPAMAAAATLILNPLKFNKLHEPDMNPEPPQQPPESPTEETRKITSVNLLYRPWETPQRRSPQHHNLAQNQVASMPSAAPAHNMAAAVGWVGRWDMVGAQQLVSRVTEKCRVQCPECLKTFCSNRSLKAHIEAIHLQKVHKCTVQGCHKMFALESSRNRHSSRLHLPNLGRRISLYQRRYAEPLKNSLTLMGYDYATAAVSAIPSGLGGETLENGFRVRGASGRSNEKEKSPNDTSDSRDPGLSICMS